MKFKYLYIEQYLVKKTKSKIVPKKVRSRNFEINFTKLIKHL